MGMRQPVTVLPPTASTGEIVNAATIAAAMIRRAAATAAELVGVR